MKCRICASECPPGAKLCRDCAATVTQPLLAAAGVPSVGRPRFAPRPERQRPTSKRPVTTTAARSEAVMAASAADGNAEVVARRPIGVQWLLLALAVACAIVYLVIRILFEHHAAPDGAQGPGDAASALTAPAAYPGGEGAPAPGALPAAAPGAAAAPADTLAAETMAEVTGAGKSAAPKGGRHKAAAKVETPVIASVEPPPPAAEPVPAPRPAPPAAQAPRDPWQVMNEGLSRCAREDWLSRGACEQRLRMQYCPGHWGLVWQCPLGPPSDHGQ